MTADHCPTCGQPVRVVSTDEGTSHYEAAAGYGAQVAALRDALVEALDFIISKSTRPSDEFAKAWAKPHHILADTASAAAGYGLVEPWRKALERIHRIATHPAKNAALRLEQLEEIAGIADYALALTEPDTATDKGS